MGLFVARVAFEVGRDVVGAFLVLDLVCGVGMIVVAAPDRAAALSALLEAEGETVRAIGHVVAGAGVSYAGAE